MSDPALYEDELDALRETVRALGGPKKVGPLLWPDKKVETASRSLSDALNPNRDERLTPSQVLMIMRLGRQAGCHGLAEYFMAEAGYARPVPVAPETEAALLATQLDAALDRAERLALRLESLRGTPSAGGQGG